LIVAGGPAPPSGSGRRVRRRGQEAPKYARGSGQGGGRNGVGQLSDGRSMISSARWRTSGSACGPGAQRSSGIFIRVPSRPVRTCTVRSRSGGLTPPQTRQGPPSPCTGRAIMPENMLAAANRLATVLTDVLREDDE